MKKFWNIIAVISLCLALSCASVLASVFLLIIFVVSMQLSGNVDWMEEIMKKD